MIAELQHCPHCFVMVEYPCPSWAEASTVCKQAPLREPVTWAVRAEPKRGMVEVRDPATRKLLRKRGPEIIYVRARSAGSAFATAKRNNPLQHHRVTGPARCATPQELGCVPTKEPARA